MTEFDFFEQDVEADTAESVVEPDSFDADITATTDFDPQDILTATPDDTVELSSDAMGDSPLSATVEAPDLDDMVTSPPDPIVAADSFDLTAFGQGAGDAPDVDHAIADPTAYGQGEAGGNTGPDGSPRPDPRPNHPIERPLDSNVQKKLTDTVSSQQDKIGG